MMLMRYRMTLSTLFLFLLGDVLRQGIFANGRSNYQPWLNSRGQWGVQSPSLAPTASPSPISDHKKSKKAKTRKKGHPETTLPETTGTFERRETKNVKKTKKHGVSSSQQREPSTTTHHRNTQASSPNSKKERKKKTAKTRKLRAFQTEKDPDFTDEPPIGDTATQTRSKVKKVKRKVRTANLEENGSQERKTYGSNSNRKAAAALESNRAPRKATVTGGPLSDLGKKKKKTTKKMDSKTLIPGLQIDGEKKTNVESGSRKKAKKGRKIENGKSSIQTPHDVSALDDPLIGVREVTAREPIVPEKNQSKEDTNRCVETEKYGNEKADQLQTSEESDKLNTFVTNPEKVGTTLEGTPSPTIEETERLAGAQIGNSTENDQKSGPSAPLSETSDNWNKKSEPEKTGVRFEDKDAFDAIEVTEPVEQSSISLPPKTIMESHGDKAPPVEQREHLESDDISESIDEVDQVETALHTESSTLPATDATDLTRQIHSREPIGESLDGSLSPETPNSEPIEGGAAMDEDIQEDNGEGVVPDPNTIEIVDSTANKHSINETPSDGEPLIGHKKESKDRNKDNKEVSQQGEVGVKSEGNEAAEVESRSIRTDNVNPSQLYNASTDGVITTPNKTVDDNNDTEIQKAITNTGKDDGASLSEKPVGIGERDPDEDPYLDPDVVNFIGKVLDEDIDEVRAWTMVESSSATDGENTTTSLNETRGGSQVFLETETQELIFDYSSSVVEDAMPVEASDNRTRSDESKGINKVEIQEMSHNATTATPNSAVEGREMSRTVLEVSEDRNTDAVVSVVTWNLAEESPSEDDAEFIRAFRSAGISKGAGSDLVLISGQECENIKPRRTEGRRSREYRRLMIKMLGQDYVPIALHLLGGIQFGLFARKSFLEEIEEVSVADVTCGIGNVFHNKGAIAAFVQVKARNPPRDSPDEPPRAKSLRMMFVTAHMAAHVKNSDARDADFWRISSELEDQAPEGFLPGQRMESQEKNRCFLFDSVDRAFFCGDLNYRIDVPREVAEFTIMAGDPETDWLDLMKHDQLLCSIIEGRAFPGFAEAKISFAPTFKFDKETGDYDTSHKQRIPAWTDRILFKPWGTRVLSYTSVSGAQHSDHRPVHGTFRINMEGRELPPTRKKRKKQTNQDQRGQ